jgi:predicted aspartyl protease
MKLLSLAMLLAAALPQTHAANSAQDAAETDIVSISRDSHDRMTVPVRIGDKGPYDFLIDTGSERTVISNDLANRLAMVPNAKATLLGVAGQETVDTVEIDEIGLGRQSYYGIVAPVLDGRHIGADGIIGLDSLQNQRVLMDFRRNLIAIDDAKNLGGNNGFEIVVTARRRSGQLILTQATIDGVRVDVVIDTGADTTIGNRALERVLSHRGNLGTTQLVSVTGQNMLAQLGLADKLTLGGASITNVMIAYADASPFKFLQLDKRPAILLGMRDMRVFRRVAIDFKSRKVLFDLPQSGDPAYFGTIPNASRLPQ